MALLGHPSLDIRAIAVTCLGHLAQLDSVKVVAEMQAHQSDDELAGRIQDALEDIEQYLQQC